MLRTDHPLYQADIANAMGYIDAGKLDGKSILVTGASGLIGSFLADCLLRYSRERKSDIRVTAMSRDKNRLKARFSYASAGDGLTLLAQDVSLPLEEAPHYDYIIHAASNVDPRSYALYPLDTMQANVAGTAHMLACLQNKPGSRLLYISSSEVYGETGSDAPRKEEDFGLVDFNQVRAAYPESKRLAELLCRSAMAQHGADCVIARPAYIYGPSMTAEDGKAAAQFIRNALAGQDIALKSKGGQLRSYCYAGDAVAGMLRILCRGATGEAYNIANRDSTLTISDLAQTAAGAAGTRVTFAPPEATEQKGFPKAQNNVLDEGKLRALGWEPLHDAAAGMRRTLSILKGGE